ncbi:uncharacterized protein LOC105427796 isoform X2 [Pogonomyrmex barbatus]|uniref:Uncharacterized protein LOC105427796 isoform X2 n=1 Tax=Pogonomyrmex barbatus TaxID=144034 RepID=A0A6I9WBE3_9HYME|nr:uncharacterized protein LOC105427796 isoform X2 [Pogonomyrmex barbatus]
MDLLDISKVDMKERLDLINRYYSELDYVEYERYKRNISSIIPTLSHVTQPKGDNFVKRFLMTIQTIYDSNYFFEYMGYHKDIFTIICDVLYYYPSNANWKTLNDISENNDKVSIIWTIMLSLFSMYIKPEMITFLEEMIM